MVVEFCLTVAHLLLCDRLIFLSGSILWLLILVRRNFNKFLLLERFCRPLRRSSHSLGLPGIGLSLRSIGSGSQVSGIRSGHQRLSALSRLPLGRWRRLFIRVVIRVLGIRTGSIRSLTGNFFLCCSSGSFFLRFRFPGNFVVVVVRGCRDHHLLPDDF